ncbi:MAG: hypothetical protein WAZ38_03250 [Prolixibacteraceae bacterium]
MAKAAEPTGTEMISQILSKETFAAAFAALALLGAYRWATGKNAGV